MPLEPEQAAPESGGAFDVVVEPLNPPAPRGRFPLWVPAPPLFAASLPPAAARQRWTRWLAVYAAGALLLMLVLVSADPAFLPAPHSSAGYPTIPEHPPIQHQTGAWSTIALPASSQGIVDFAPMPGDPADLFVCLRAGGQSSGDPFPNSITVWRSGDAGLHWTQVTSIPAITGVGCAIQAAPDDPERIALLATKGAGLSPACAGTIIYLSSDGGAQWGQVPHTSIAPITSSTSECLLRVTRTHLYFLTSSLEDMNDQQPAIRQQRTILERSDNNGQSWERADQQLGNDAIFFPTLIGNDDTLITSLIRTTNPAQPSEVWLTRDAGRHWSRLGTLNGFSTMIVAAQPPGNTRPTASYPIYALEGEQIPSNLYRLQVLQSQDGHIWQALPPLPVPGASRTRLGLAQVLGVLPNGDLVTFGVDPKAGVSASPSVSPGDPGSEQWLWFWNPHASRWESTAAPVPCCAFGPLCAALCWHASLSPGASAGAGQGAYLWVSSLAGESFTLSRLFLPDIAGF